MLDKRDRRWTLRKARPADPEILDDDMITRHADLFDVEPPEAPPSEHPLFAVRPGVAPGEDRMPLFGVEPMDDDAIDLRDLERDLDAD